MVIIHTEFGLIWAIAWPDEEDLFLKFAIRENRSFTYEKLNFFLGKLYQKSLCVLHFDYNGDSPLWVWFNLNNSLTRWIKYNF